MSKIIEFSGFFLLTKFCNKKMTEEFIIARKTCSEKGSSAENEDLS